MKKFNGVIARFNSDLWAYHVMVPDKCAKPFLVGENKRVICTINDKVTFQCALMPNGKGAYFINLNKENRKKAGADEGDEISIKLEKDDSEYGLPVPEEFRELLKQDPEGDEAFHALTKGKQRSLLHIIGKPKSSQLRINKAIVILNYLKFAKGKIDSRELLDALKHTGKH